MSDDIRWNREKHEERLTEQQQKDRQIVADKAMDFCFKLYKEFKSRAQEIIGKGQVKEYLAEVRRLQDELWTKAHDVPEIKDWVGATCHMLDLSVRQAAKKNVRRKYGKKALQMPCPCGSGKSYKNCCGGTAPITNGESTKLRRKWIKKYRRG